MSMYSAPTWYVHQRAGIRANNSEAITWFKNLDSILCLDNGHWA